MSAILRIIGRSISPIFKQDALEHRGIDTAHLAWEMGPGQVGGFTGDASRLI